MLDIQFYMNVYNLKQKVMSGELKDRSEVFKKLESYRNKKPLIYNIETTNACNMRCEMCPRTTMMTRPVETLDMDVYHDIINQLDPFSDDELAIWDRFVESKYGIPKYSMSENHFFLYIIPSVIVLHGYGDPLLDKYMSERVDALTKRKIPSYFSCNPANIDIDRTVEMFEKGLGYVKYSIESVDDLRHKQIRGNASNFNDSYKKILHLLNLKKKYSYKTTIIITMLNLQKEMQETEYKKLKDAFEGLDVYIYLKSQDQHWYQEKQIKTQSIHWTEFCQFPWSSMSIKSNGEAVMCVEDFNNEIILGDSSVESLYDIWNGEKYKKLREDHFNLTPGIKCTEQCDMTLLGSLVE